MTARSGDSLPRRLASKQLGRGLVLVLGVALAVYCVRSVGFGTVLGILEQAGRWLPLVIGLEMGIASLDLLGAFALLGEAATRVPTATWARAVALAYSSSIFLPAGRSTGEAARAATIAPWVGAGNAASACFRLQACALIANVAISLLAAVATALGGAAFFPLAVALLVNGVACGLLAALIFLLARSPRVAAWLRKHFPSFADSHSPSPESPTRGAPQAVAYSFLGRLLQTCQYGIAVHAVGGLITPRLALIAQGIHLVGAAVGDMVPNQVGATDGAYRLFASSLGFSAEPARAISIALVARTAQIALATLCVLAAVLIKTRATAPAGGEPSKDAEPAGERS